MNRPTLTVELVPRTVWYSNVRSLVTSTQWNKCKRITSRAAGALCEVCGGRGGRWPVECHEVWSYNEDTLVQKLERLIALCPACHEVKHIGLAESRGRLAQATAHLCKVNGWSPEDAKTYLEVAFEIWSLRSNFQWKLDLSYLASIGVNLRHPLAER